MKKYNKIFLYIPLLLVFQACKKLDIKPRLSLVVPETLQDFQGIMDNSNVMNAAFTLLGEISSDNYYVTNATYNALTTLQHQNAYIWNKDLFKGVTSEPDWQYSYQKAFYSNIVLDGLSSISINPTNQGDYYNVKGQALFHRANAFFMISQEFAPPYNQATASSDLGIVLRLTSDLNKPSVRSNVQQSYDQIISDLLQAKDMLPITPLYKTRPSKPAAYALLARIYLSINDYKNALICADSCLRIYNTLINYNTLSSSAAFPFTQFNNEVIFHGYTSATILNNSRAIVDSILYKSYAVNDLRKMIFFGSNNNNTFKFKGNYTGTTQMFEGIATDEVYLIRAECSARLGNINAAMSDYNVLLTTRYKTGTYVAANANSTDDALALILSERRKELLFRGLRWTDLRRLNKETKYAVTLGKTIKGITYTLPPNDNRYTLAIPDYIISLNAIQQNP